MMKTLEQLENEYTRDAFIASHKYLKGLLLLKGKPEHIVVVAIKDGETEKHDISPGVAHDLQALEKGLSYTKLGDGVTTKTFIKWEDVSIMFSPPLENQLAPLLHDPFGMKYMELLAQQMKNPVDMGAVLLSQSSPKVVFDATKPERADVMEKRSKIKLC